MAEEGRDFNWSEECQRLRKRIATLENALRLAQMSLEQGQTINGHICANGPTIGSVIAAALKK